MNRSNEGGGLVPPAAHGQRKVYQAEALAWMQEHPAPAQSSVITSLPDVSEIPQLTFEQWRHWFVTAARAVLEYCHEDGAAIFYQSDIRHEGNWVDKSFLVQNAAIESGHRLLWHKIVCRNPPGTISHHRAGYSHLLCFTRQAPTPLRSPGPDVLIEREKMPWPKAMGISACELACRFLRETLTTQTVVDPFCGYGTALAVANGLDMNAIGVDLSAKRCRIARNVQHIDGRLVRPLRERPDPPQTDVES
jgi:hypothetical protein